VTGAGAGASDGQVDRSRDGLLSRQPEGPPDRPLDLRLAGAACAAWLTTLVLLGRPAAVAAAVGVAGVVCLAGVLLMGRRASAGLALLIVGLLAAVGGTGLRVWSRDSSPLTALARDRAAVTLILVVSDDPHPVSRPAAFGPPPVVLHAQVREVTAGGRRVALGGAVLVLASDPHWRRLLPSQQLRAEGRLSVARGGDLTVAVLSARGPPHDVGRPSVPQRAAGFLRSGLRTACSGLAPKVRGLLPGLVVGDTAGLDPALAQDFRNTGLTHLVAVSGTNCAIVCGSALLLARRLRAGPKTAALVAGTALVGFVVLVRPSPSVLRAAVMGSLALLALSLGRSRQVLPGLCASVVLLVLVDPPLALSAGFALSVLATAGLLLLAPPWRDALRRRGVPAGWAEALAVLAAAQVACAPVIAAISGQVGGVAVLANLLAVPAVAPATLLGVAATLLSSVSPAAAHAAATLAGLPTAWLVIVAERGARLPGASIAWPGGSAGGLLLAGVLALTLTLARLPQVRRLSLSAACAAGVVALPLHTIAPGWPPAGWVLVVCDVGQGDALVVNAGPGAGVVVDTGPDPAGVDRCLHRLHVVRVPLLVLTHLHADHVGGLLGVLHGRAVGAVEVGPLHEPGPTWGLVQRQLRSAGVRLVSAVVGEQRVVHGVELQVLAPAAAFHSTRSDPNNSSIVLRVRTAGRTLLLAGDAEVDAQAAIVAGGADLHADVLKVAHHGSAYQDPRFLAAVHPAVALVSVGAGNPYGHPSLPVLARLRLLGARVQRTDLDGDLAVAVVRGRLYVVAGGAGRSGLPARRTAARSPPGSTAARSPPGSTAGPVATGSTAGPGATGQGVTPPEPGRTVG